MNISAELILSNLPIFVVGWTALTLCWGVYVQAAFMRMIRHALVSHGSKRETDPANLYFIMLANVALAIVLAAEGFVINFIDVLIVINIFYDAYLIASSYNVCKWWKASHQHTSS